MPVSRLLQLLLGPELCWLAVYGVTVVLARRNLPATEAGNQFIEQLGWMLPLASIPLSFWLRHRSRNCGFLWRAGPHEHRFLVEQGAVIGAFCPQAGGIQPQCPGA
jgi:hypothetical protein